MWTIRTLAIAIAAAAATSAQGPREPSLQLDVIPSVTASLSDVRLSTALDVLGREAGVSITLAPDVADVTIRELKFVKVAFQDAFVQLVHGACLDYAITGTRSILITRPRSGGKSEVRGPRAIVWPDCSADYTPPAAPRISRGTAR